MKAASDMEGPKQKAQGVDLGNRKQQFDKDLASGVFAKRIQQTKTLAAEEAKLGKRISYAKLVAEQGLFAAALTRTHDKLTALTAKLAPVSSAAAKVFIAGTAAIAGFAAAASPRLVDTFTGSIKWLGAAIGSAFVPYLATAVGWIQSLARWVQSLDPATRSAAAGFIIWGVAIAGTLFIGGKLIIFISELTAALKALGLAQLFVWVAANPGKAILGAVAALAAVYAAKKGIDYLTGTGKEGPNGTKKGALQLSAQQPAQFLEIADAWKQAQLAGASIAGPDAEALKEQRKTNEILERIAAGTEQNAWTQNPASRSKPSPNMPGGKVTY